MHEKSLLSGLLTIAAGLGGIAAGCALAGIALEQPVNTVYREGDTTVVTEHNLPTEDRILIGLGGLMIFVGPGITYCIDGGNMIRNRD